MSPAAALALIRRTRRRLEGLRLLRAAARGALVLGGGAIVLVLLGKATGRAVTWSWWLPAAGALGGLLAALATRRVDLVGAALLLDARWRADERFTTLLSNPSSPRAPRWAAELEAGRRALSLPWPREAGLVPVALFLLFAATLVPTAREPEPDLAVAGEPEEPAPADASPADPEGAAKALSGAGALTPAQEREVERAIEAAFARPEERARARAELTKAKGGDATASERLGRALVEGAGALGGEKAPRAGAAPPSEEAERARLSSPYPDDEEYLRAYRIEKARLLREDR